MDCRVCFKLIDKRIYRCVSDGYIRFCFCLAFFMLAMVIHTGYAAENRHKADTGKEQAELNPDRLKKECRAVLGNNAGTIIVIDLKAREPVVVINPNIAFSLESSPGSIFKLVTAAALLENGLVNPDESVDCKNYIKIGNRDFICSKPGGHGRVNMTQAIGFSCSIWFYMYSGRLSVKNLSQCARMFKIGMKIPEGASPAPAKPGICRIPSNRSDFAAFSVGDSKELKITPFQAANILSIVATGKCLKNCGKSPSFKSGTYRILRKGMETAAKSGTCREIGLAGLNGAGKTGTAENPRIPGRYHGWFIGYYPADAPKYGIVVFLEDGKGYIDAVPMGVKIMKTFGRQVQR
ncbi:MAG: hypothetical protein LWY06_20685 [Firmicutes bacterium]|nr:hypothetical protein [Bacillota bacterium]